MKAYCIMHVPFEGPGYIEDWFNSHGINLNFLKMYEKVEFPESEKVDFLLIMGGPMNIYEYSKYPYLKPEKEFIHACIEGNKKVLGICLGAQLIADVLGSKTYPNMEKEIGWFPVAGDRSFLPGTFVPFHWHGETFDLPDGCTHLASSLVCRNQAFSFKENVLALQLHLEVTPELVEALLENASDDLTEGEWIQDAAEIRAGLSNMEANRDALYRLLEEFTDINQ